MRALILVFAFSLVSEAVAGEVASNTIGATISGVGFSVEWGVDSSGILRQKINGIASQEVSWPAASGGCKDPILGPYPVIPVPPVQAWTAACSGGVRCQNGRRQMGIQSSIYYQSVAGGKQELKRFIDDTFDLGSC